jgi:hypothetical protein
MLQHLYRVSCDSVFFKRVGNIPKLVVVVFLVQLFKENENLCDLDSLK